MFRRRDIELHLLTSAVLLDRCVDDVARHFRRVVVSLDAATESDYQRIRGVNALGTVERGVTHLRRAAPAIPVSARATIHRLNFRALPDLLTQPLPGEATPPSAASPPPPAAAPVPEPEPEPQMVGAGAEADQLGLF